MTTQPKQDAPTPLTDAVIILMLSDLQSGTQQVVHADFARTLERALQAANAMADAAELNFANSRKVELVLAKQYANQRAELEAARATCAAIEKAKWTLVNFVSTIATEKGEYGRMGYNQPTQRAMEAFNLLASLDAATRSAPEEGR